jgi:hypothetical protein
MRDELVEFFEGAGIEQEIDPFARGELAGVVLPAQPVLAAAELGPAFEIGKDVVRLQAFTACDFSQSFRNFSRPMLVSGWLYSMSMTDGGQVQMSAPIFAASTI